MRKRIKRSGLTVNAIAGTHVVTLGLDLDAAKRNRCLGFAIQREDHTEDERYWLSGMKTFEATDPKLGPGGQVSSRAHPFQTFQWADYSAKPEHDYTYKVVPLYGTPQKLSEGDGVGVRVRTEAELGKPHSAFFNRGAVASQEYARRFQNKRPDELEGEQRDAALRWLSRGLEEALIAFIGRAVGPKYGLYGAFYEFQWPRVLDALRDADEKAEAKVNVIYDGIPGGTGPLAKNTAAIASCGIGNCCAARTTGKIMHNKFLVLTKDDKPIAVWTGSTNVTENGLFGHSNCGHIVEDEKVAASYLTYWKELKTNPDAKSERVWVETNNPSPQYPCTRELVEVFSPRKGVSMLDWYANIAGEARKALLMTFAFGMHEKFQKVYDRRDGVLRFALMEKEGNGQGLAKGKQDIARIRALPNVCVAIGNSITENSFDRWLQERRQLTKEANVRWVHTKYMLVDPLGDEPVVVTGSANFSAASTDTNNENMLAIRKDTRIADIYVGEFMRLYSHYAYREAVAIARAKGTAANWHPNYLVPKDGWQADYFRAGHPRALRRTYFSGG